MYTLHMIDCSMLEIGMGTKLYNNLKKKKII
jgi:hypothetical protein